ncbi:MAG: hypothetical protein DBX59_05680 [Bacillota bacterium]|nr:MAG: hypothetical protein DBX59_05680 [Bacillota bacterium]
MIHERIDLYEYFRLPRGEKALGYLNAYAPDNMKELPEKRRPAMVVAAGGGYQFLSDREKEPVAIRFFGNGYAAFTLEYSINTAFPAPLIEACMAVAYVRENAEKYCVDKTHIAAVGFSAGGHLIGMLATLFADEAVKNALGDRNVRPDAVILSYPVITSNPRFWHEGSIETISGGSAALKEKLSLENRVEKNSVPAFIWHTSEDGGVPVYNSLAMAGAYAALGVPFELHIFEKGPHGLSVANVESAQSENDNVLINDNAAAWVDLAIDWLKERGFKVFAKK